MILKKKWIELLQENNTGNYSLSQQGLLDLISSVDLLFSKLVLGEESSTNLSRLSNIYSEVISHFITNTEENNYWADMPIFVSSWTWKDKAPFGLLVLRLTQYLGFYKKILTDKGLARSVLTHRNFDNRGTVDGTNKGYNSETPQVNLTNFDDGIKYASSLNKNEDHSQSRSYGNSSLDITSKSWDEEEKNMKLLFYNDLCDFVKQMPQWIYSEYSLDSMPTLDIVKETFKYFKDMYERR